ncbi:MAG: hypothetical protein AB7O73_14010 [Bacteroidia bacterium]
MNLHELEKISGDKARIFYSSKSGHVLSKLHAEFDSQVHLIFKNRNIKNVIQEDYNKRNDELRRFTGIFDKLDNWSYAFRYPVQNNGVTKSFNEGDTINIAEIIPVYEKTKAILKYTLDVLSDSV